jgi:hypothetical protein
MTESNSLIQAVTGQLCVAFIMRTTTSAYRKSNLSKTLTLLSEEFTSVSHNDARSRLGHRCSQIQKNWGRNNDYIHRNRSLGMPFQTGLVAILQEAKRLPTKQLEPKSDYS